MAYNYARLRLLGETHVTSPVTSFLDLVLQTLGTYANDPLAVKVLRRHGSCLTADADALFRSIPSDGTQRPGGGVLP